MQAKKLEETDPEISDLLKKELQRQESDINLIPSENYASKAVLQALGSVATNKYAEGYPKNRYYGGNRNIDELEMLAIERAKKLFLADHANVQPLSGAPANLAVYSALLKPGDTVLGMDLTHGGHLTHGHPVTLPAKIYKFVRYKTTNEGLIDYEQVEALAKEHKPRIVLCGYSSYTREIDYSRFKEIADSVGAYTMADIAHIAGLIAGGAMKNPVPIFDVATATTHKTLRGPRGGIIFCKKELAQTIDKAVFPGLQGGPHENNIAALAVALKEASSEEFKAYAHQVLKNAKAICNTIKGNGMKMEFDGTENHMVLMDVTQLGLTGRIAQDLLESAGIIVNKNVIPDDRRSPQDPSGIRLGAPAVTTRGFKEKEVSAVGQIISDILKNPKDKKTISGAEKTARELSAKFPVYG